MIFDFIFAKRGSSYAVKKWQSWLESDKKRRLVRYASLSSMRWVGKVADHIADWYLYRSDISPVLRSIIETKDFTIKTASDKALTARYGRLIYRCIGGRRSFLGQGWAYFSGNSNIKPSFLPPLSNIARHQWGLAVDLMPRNRVWTDKDGNSVQADLGISLYDLRKHPLIQWGGFWKSPYDAEHFELKINPRFFLDLLYWILFGILCVVAYKNRDKILNWIRRVIR